MSTNKPSTTNDPRWTCHAGTIIGKNRAGVNVASGIRYARADRYKAPEGEKPSTSPIIADKPAHACPQPEDVFSKALNDDVLQDLIESEDCLQLTITCPEDLEPSERVPAMVWIHGGAYISGAGDAAWYRPMDLVREHRVIVVNINFRLGFLGYLGQIWGYPANLGLLDQIEAFKWIQRNIEAFGGDRNNVTAFGQSAGGDVIVQLMISDGVEGLFHRAIIQSAPLGLTYKRQSINKTMQAACAYLKPDSSLKEIQDVQGRFLRGMKGIDMPFGSQYGHNPLPSQNEVDQRWQAVAPKYDILIGNSARELSIFASTAPALYYLLKTPVLKYLAEALIVQRISNWMYKTPIDAFAARHRDAGGKGYRYTFNSESSDIIFRATHCSELPYLFTHSGAWKGHKISSGIPWSTLETRAVKLRAIWAEFAAHGTAPIGAIPGLIDVRSL